MARAHGYKGVLTIPATAGFAGTQGVVSGEFTVNSEMADARVFGDAFKHWGRDMSVQDRIEGTFEGDFDDGFSFTTLIAARAEPGRETDGNLVVNLVSGAEHKGFSVDVLITPTFTMNRGAFTRVRGTWVSQSIPIATPGGGG